MWYYRNGHRQNSENWLNMYEKKQTETYTKTHITHMRLHTQSKAHFRLLISIHIEDITGGHQSDAAPSSHLSNCISD